MYDPLALDVQRVNETGLRRHADRAVAAALPVAGSAGRVRPRLTHLRATITSLAHRRRPATEICAH